MRLFYIGTFGAVGTLARYGLQLLMGQRPGSGFPWGTLLVNLTGCFFLGLIMQFLFDHGAVSEDLRLAIGVGFFGGYTTFSSFGWETAKMIESGGYLRVIFYVTASAVGGVVLSMAGIRLASRL
ncbi:MAG: fluoride efflux transporter CrcB [Candidatus Acidiferrum sp.]